MRNNKNFTLIRTIGTVFNSSPVDCNLAPIWSWHKISGVLNIFSVAEPYIPNYLTKRRRKVERSDVGFIERSACFMNLTISLRGYVLKSNLRFENRKREERSETDGGDYRDWSSEACPHY